MWHLLVTSLNLFRLHSFCKSGEISLSCPNPKDSVFLFQLPTAQVVNWACCYWPFLSSRLATGRDEKAFLARQNWPFFSCFYFQARFWMQVVDELRRGVRLKKINFSRTPIEYELTPYEILMEDIRSRWVVLKLSFFFFRLYTYWIYRDKQEKSIYLMMFIKKKSKALIGILNIIIYLIGLIHKWPFFRIPM